MDCFLLCFFLVVLRWIVKFKMRLIIDVILVVLIIFVICLFRIFFVFDICVIVLLGKIVKLLKMFFVDLFVISFSEIIFGKVNIFIVNI